MATLLGLQLKQIREEMIRRDWSRRYVNAAVSRIERFFAGCAEKEIVPKEVDVPPTGFRTACCGQCGAAQTDCELVDEEDGVTAW
jgi:hypothetical protein